MLWGMFTPCLRLVLRLSAKISNGTPLCVKGGTRTTWTSAWITHRDRASHGPVQQGCAQPGDLGAEIVSREPGAPFAGNLTVMPPCRGVLLGGLPYPNGESDDTATSEAN